MTSVIEEVDDPDGPDHEVTLGYCNRAESVSETRRRAIIRLMTCALRPPLRTLLRLVDLAHQSCDGQCSFVEHIATLDSEFGRQELTNGS